MVAAPQNTTAFAVASVYERQVARSTF